MSPLMRLDSPPGTTASAFLPHQGQVPHGHRHLTDCGTPRPQLGIPCQDGGHGAPVGARLGDHSPPDSRIDPPHPVADGHAQAVPLFRVRVLDQLEVLRSDDPGRLKVKSRRCCRRPFRSRSRWFSSLSARLAWRTHPPSAGRFPCAAPRSPGWGFHRLEPLADVLEPSGHAEPAARKMEVTTPAAFCKKPRLGC